MNNPILIKAIFNIFFSSKHINISFYDNITQTITSHITPDDTSEIAPLGTIPIMHFHEKYTKEILTYNKFENFIIIQCENDELSGCFLCGPYVTKPISKYDLTELLQIYGFNLNKYTQVNDYFNKLPFVHPNDVSYLKLNIVGLTKLSLDDIKVHYPYLIEIETETNDTSPQKIVNSIYDIWKSDIHFNNLKDVKIFYRDLFTSETFQERIDILGKYFYITQPFEYFYFTHNLDRFRTLKLVSFVISGFTLCYALQYGLDNDTALNISIFFTSEIEKAKTIEELVFLRNKMLLRFAHAVNNKQSKPYSKLINKCLSYIDDHIKDKLTLIDIADNLGYNLSYLSTSFKKETGSTIKDYILNKKIDLAKPMLIDSNISIADLSDFFNFSSYNHFSNTFKKFVGVSPTEYRSKNL